MSKDKVEIDEPITSSDYERFFALNSALSDVDAFNDSLEFKKNDFVQRILDLSDEKPSSLARNAKIAIDFSSPNIAKPFHVGHLRSTFIGRSLANLFTSNGCDVVRINYLGDWGTQFGLLAAGFELFNDDIDTNSSAQSKSNPLRRYFDIYVKANQHAEANPEFRQKALGYFARLENGEDPNAMRFWRQVVDDSITELKTLYSRLNVDFDVWESEHSAALPARALVQDLEKRKVAIRTDENAVGIRLSDAHFVPLTKSDGSTLYLTREIHTALLRFDNLSCRKLFYVVDITQVDHFKLLQTVLNKIGRPDVADAIVHVRFGRVRNMSTRKGMAVFVDDLLDEGARRVEEEILTPDPKTKAPAGTSERRQLAEQLSLAGLIVHDLKKRMVIEYDFDWSLALQTTTESGIMLQKTFCRLSSICQQCEYSPVDLDTFQRSIKEKEAVQLMAYLSRHYASTLKESMDTLEPSLLTQYLVELRRMSGNVVRRLRLVDAPPQLKSSRFLLFNVARRALGLGMRLLGAKPLARI